MKEALYENALDQVALRYAQTILANRIDITPAELASIVENNWPKIVAEALAIRNQVLMAQSQPTFNNLKPDT